MEEVLIAAVFKREPLWNPSNKHHKNVLILKKLWEEVAQEVNKDDKTVRMKWKNLRTYFFREVRKLDKPKSGDGGGNDFTSSWQFFKQMMFLKDKVSESERDTNIDIESITSDSNEVAQSPNIINLEETSSHASSIASSTRSELTHKTKKQSKTSHTDRHDELVQLEKRKIELLEKETLQERDDDFLFFQSLLPYMKKIPLRKKLKLRSVIQDAILDQLPTESNENIAETIELPHNTVLYSTNVQSQQTFVEDGTSESVLATFINNFS